MKRKYKYIDYLIITIVIIFFVLLTYRFKNYFGSDNDWVTQHTLFPEYFRNVFYKTGSIIPNISFHLGAGQNIFNLVYYGFLSPYTLLSYFFPFISMTLYYQIINIIILIVSGILFYNFMNSHRNNRIVSLTSSLIFILATPFIFHMHRHFMFVNYMPFLIMGLFGVDKYLKNNKKSLLIISVFLMIMTSYYYSIPSIMVLCIYYLNEYLYKYKKIIIKRLIIDILKFVMIIFVGIMLAGVLLLPTAYTLLVGRESISNYNIIKLLIPSTNFHSIFNDSYAIGLSSFGFITLLYLFFTKKRNNIIIATIISIILFIPLFRYLLNGGLYIREKCFIPFLPLFVYYMSFMLKDIFYNKIDYKKFSIFLIIIWGLLFYNNRLLRLYGILVLFIISLFLYKKFKKKIIIILVILLSLTSKLYYETVNNYDLSFNLYNDYFPSKVSDSINRINNSDHSFYRTGNLYNRNRTVNKIYNDNYYSTNLYASTFNNNYYDFIRNVFKLNVVETNNMLFPSNTNLLFNSFMGVKYVYSEIDPGFGYQLIDDNIYLNNYALPIIYARSNILSIDEFNSYNDINKEELLLNNVIVNGESNNPLIDLNSEKILLDYEIESIEGIEIKGNGDNYDLIVNENGIMNIKINNDISDKLLLINISKLEGNLCNDILSLEINNIANVLPCSDSYYYTNNTTFHYMLGDNTNELKLLFTKGKYHIDNIEAYIINYQEVVSFNYDELNNVVITNNEIVGDINISDDSYLVTSIPYDSGFSIYIDDKLVDKEKVNIDFIGSKINEGYHKIRIKYHSPWLNYGLITSGLGLIIFISIIIFDRKKKVK